MIQRRWWVAAFLAVAATGAVANAAPRRSKSHGSVTDKPDSAAAAPIKSELGNATLSKGSVAATGRREAILSVTRFGRYSVTANSPQGTALQLVSRMLGPGEIQGEAGTSNGRLDAFLDRGDYKIVALSHEKGTGRATLKVHEFTELNATVPLLVETKPVDADLDDFQQLSFWVEVKERDNVFIEAAGRNLADLRFWKDGNWLVDAEPSIDVVTPVPGRPLAVRRLNAALEPGLYLVTAYGGPPQAWAEEGKEHPLHLRWGIPHLATAGRERHEVGPFGYDRWLVPNEATYFRLELPEAKPAQIKVRGLDKSTALEMNGTTAEVTKNSVPPATELSSNEGGITWHEVLIVAPEGQPYTFEHFTRSWVYPLQGDGDYWVSMVHSGHPGDSIDATAILSDEWVYQHQEPIGTSLVPIDSSHAWKRRFNLLDDATLFFDVKSAGKYEVTATGEGVDATYRFEPFLTARPPHYEAPAFQPAGSRWDLSAGYYVLKARPSKKGIVELAVKPVAGMFSWAWGPGDSAPTVMASAHFPKVHLLEHHSYQLYSNQQPGVATGALVRKLPLDLSDALPVTQIPGETLTFPFSTQEEGTLRARREDGTFLPFSVDGGPASPAATVTAGSHTAVLTIDAASKETVLYSLGFSPRRLMKETPLPVLSDVASRLPNFPVLEPGKPQYLDLDREAETSFLVKADKADLFQLQSTGLLATGGVLRTRTVPNFDKEEQNGVGRNFLVQQYLREGDYQVTVSAKGKSKGHLGMMLAHTPSIDAGELTDEVPARVTVPTGSAVLYRFKVKKAGSYKLEAYGLGRTFRARLEDGDGWPLVAPNAEAHFDQWLDAGSYRLVILPEPVAAKQVTLLQRQKDAPQLKGHGPHPLSLAACSSNTWLESEERTPDSWTFEVPAPIDATVSLSDEMTGTLFRVGDGGSSIEAATIPPQRGWTGPLQPGKYRIEARCSRQNNRVGYQACVSPVQMVEGLSRTVRAPVELPLSVGRESLVELSSFGHDDVRGSLFDANGRLLARNDDRPDDWNFHIAQKLGPGRYTLRVDPVGAPSASVSVSMEVPAEAQEAMLTLPAHLELKPGSGQHLYPLTIPSGGDVLLVSARAQETVGIAVEKADGAAWVPLGTNMGRASHLEIPLSGGSYRLRVWSIDRRGNPITLRATAFAATKVDESSLSHGVSLSAAAGSDLAMGAAHVALSRPGTFRLEGEGAHIRYVPGTDRPAEPALDGAMVAPGKSLWLFADLSDAKARVEVRAERQVLSLSDKDGLTLPVPVEGALVCDVEAPKGPLVVLSSSRGGQPGARISEAPSSAGVPEGLSMAVGPRSAITVALAPQHPAAVVWEASPGEPIETRLRAIGFAPPSRERFAAGVLSGMLAAGGVQAWDLPSGTNRLRLSAAAGTLAVLSHGDDVESVMGGEEPIGSTVESGASRLTLLRVGEGPAPFEIEAIPLAKGGASVPLSSAAPFEKNFGAAGSIRLTVPGGPGSTVHVRGTERPATMISGDGLVQMGQDLAVPAKGGTLVIAHDPGWTLAWIDQPQQEGAGLWGAASAGTATKVQAPLSVALEGALQTLRVETTSAEVVHLRSASPVVSQVVRGGEPPRVELHPQGLVIDEYLPRGEVEITLRPVGGGLLSGTVDLTTSPVTPIGEGLGPEALLGAGDTRIYSFEVSRPGSIGVGVRADSDAVEASLLDGTGRKLASGVVQMPEVKPGTYLLAVHVAGNGSPARIRPSVVGLKEPDSGPPDDIKRAFVNPDADKTSFSARFSNSAGRQHQRQVEEGEGEGEGESEGNMGTTHEGEGSDESGD